MAEYIKKEFVVSMLTAFENELQQYKPFNCFEQTMYRRLCEIEMEIGKSEGAAVPEWISVEKGLPKTIPCDAGTEYSEAVNILTTGRKVLTAIYDGTDFIADAAFWDAEGEEITHWTPVLLPLPQPTKGE